MSGIQVSGIWNNTLFYVTALLNSFEDVGTSLNLEHCCGSCQVVSACAANASTTVALLFSQRGNFFDNSLQLVTFGTVLLYALLHFFCAKSWHCLHLTLRIVFIALTY